MAKAFTSPLSIFPFSFKPNPLPSLNNTILFPKSPLIISAPITIASAKNRHTDSNNTVIVDSDVDDEDGDEDADEDEEFIAFKDMRRWEMNKPAGFGEGKAYDTTMEEKLLEEMEKERAAQLAAEKNKTEMDPKKKQEKQPPPLQKDVVPSGPCVRLGNLPKKKNIHRDLQAAFKGFKGIVNISPAVVGNQKTRDPICKGFAFVEFVSQEAALRFVGTFSKQDILFGKVQKKISFDVINSEQSVIGPEKSSQPKPTKIGDKKQEEFVGRLIVDKTVKEPAVHMNGISAPLSYPEEREMEIRNLDIAHLSDNENDNDVHGLGPKNLELSIQNGRKQSSSNKKVVKKKSTKAAKSSLPNSMARLKIKERTVLAGVFTKYGGRAASTSDE